MFNQIFRQLLPLKWAKNSGQYKFMSNIFVPFIRLYYAIVLNYANTVLLNINIQIKFIYKGSTNSFT